MTALNRLKDLTSIKTEMQKKSRIDKERLRKLTQTIINLPTLPTVVAKMIELIDDPRSSARSLGRLVKTDQVLTARILRLANSAFYGFPNPISNRGFSDPKCLCWSPWLRT